MRLISITIVLVLFACSTGVLGASPAPQQIHIAYAENAADVVVSWTCQPACSKPVVELDVAAEGAAGHLHTNTPSLHAATHEFIPEAYTYSDGGWQGELYRVTLTPLNYSASYSYRVGDKSSSIYSSTYTFNTKPSPSIPLSSFSPFTVLIVGDMGVDNSTSTIDGMLLEHDKSLQRREDDESDPPVEFVLHTGDIAYADGEQVRWDEYMRKIEPVAAKWPYMVCPGNHEHHYNFSAYRHRFNMPNFSHTDSLWYSFTYGPLLVVSMSTEHPFHQGSVQYAWLESVLQGIDRNKTPWVYLMGHRPMYCSSDDYYDCRIFGPKSFRPTLEPLLRKYQVDFAMWAHVHSYERLWPVWNDTVEGETYTQPKGTTHWIAGMGGSREGLAYRWFTPSPSWSAKRDVNFGYMRMRVFSASLVKFEYITVSSVGENMDGTHMYTAVVTDAITVKNDHAEPWPMEEEREREREIEGERDYRAEFYRDLCNPEVLETIEDKDHIPGFCLYPDL